MSVDITGFINWIREWLDDVYALKSEIPNGMSLDNDVTQNSSNAVKSSGIYSALSYKSDIGHEHSISQIVGLFQQIYPVGAIYMSVNDVNPAILFGGNWEQIEDAFLLSSGSTYTNGDVGGEATHALTKDELPSFSHSISRVNSYSSGTQYLYKGTSSTAQGTAVRSSSTSLTHGSNQPHNNMPPYLVVNVWKRVPYYYNDSAISWDVSSVSNNIGRKCYKNICSFPDSDYITVECIANVVSIGKWFYSGLCLTNGEPVDNTTTSSENYGKKVIVGFSSSDSYTNNAPIKGTGGVNLNKSTDYFLKFVVRDKMYFDWEIRDLNDNLLSSGNFESDVSNYTHLSYHSFEGVNMSINEFKVY